MELGTIGLRRMGNNMVRRLHKAGHRCVVYDRDMKRNRVQLREVSDDVDFL